MRPFTYHCPGEMAAAIRMAAAGGLPTQAPAQFLAGGTTLLDLMKLDTMRPAELVDLKQVGKDFRAIRQEEHGLYLGAFATMAEAQSHPLVAEQYPVIAQSLALAASPQLRNMATLAAMCFSAPAAIISAIPVGLPATSARRALAAQHFSASTASMRFWAPVPIASPLMPAISRKA